MIDATHDLARKSWVASANETDTDFPIQNLPFGRFRLAGETRWRVGVAIGDCVLDLAALEGAAPADMAALLLLDADARRALRQQLSRGLTQGAREAQSWAAWLTPQHDVTLGLPCDIRDYTDFYAGIHHALAVGKLFRPDQPLLPNYRWVPIGYHGRASTILPSGKLFCRPQGQLKSPDAVAPIVGPTERLDFELELAAIIGRPNPLGEPIPLIQAEQHVVGLALFNDWSARDIQAWEYQPLGPFLGKSFASTLSPWIVTLEALAPFRAPLNRPQDAPPSLPYLESAANRAAGAFDIDLEVRLQTAAMRQHGEPAVTLSRSNFAQAAWWTLAQLVAHHTLNGCALSPGDLLATGTLSGPRPEDAGSLLELTRGAAHPIALPNGEMRRFLEDGDSIQLCASCQREGFRRIGFGPCEATVLPARE